MNLLQFVPNRNIANNYLKSSIYLKDAYSYRKADGKSEELQSGNLKFDDSEGKTSNWSIRKNQLFISCFTAVCANNFSNGELKEEFANQLKNGSIDSNGIKVQRPFITVNCNNLKDFIGGLCNQINKSIKEKRVNSSGAFFKQIIYLSEEDYHKKEIEQDESASTIRGTVSGRYKKIYYDDESQNNLHELLTFLYLTKPDRYSAQQEFRLGVAFDDPIPENELFIPVQDSQDLHRYVTVHDYEDINHLHVENF